MGFLRRRFLKEEQSELEAIRENLRNVLSAKRGTSAFFPDLGLSEPTHRSAEEGILRFSEEIRATVARYEPRVRVIEIDEAWGDDDRPRLEVHLEVVTSGVALVLRVDPLDGEAGPIPEPPDELEP